jgi:phage terminase large subunit-like protein
LLHSYTEELFYGGAGGGGKSDAILFGALQFVEEKNYAALILRRTYSDLSLPSSLMNRAHMYLAGTRAKWNEQRKTYTFPSGSTLTFGYLETENDKYRYASAEFQYIAFDELTQFTETQYTFLFSRLRKLKNSTTPLRMRSASNPGGIGHDWVKTRFIDSDTRKRNAVFIKALMSDNPALDQETYLASLANADQLTRDRIEKGDWDAGGGDLFKRNDFRYWTKQGDFIILKSPTGTTEFDLRKQEIFFTIDPASSVSELADYTVISVWTVSPTGDLVWLECYRFKAEIPDILPHIQRVARIWKPSFIAIEAVMSNRGVFQLAQRSVNPILPCREVSPMGRDKRSRAIAASTLAKSGRIYLPAMPCPFHHVGQAPTRFPIDEVLSELCRFTGDEKRDSHDDIVDTLAYAVECQQTRPQKSIAPKIIGGQ